MADEGLEVQRLGAARHVLGRHDGGLDHQQVRLGGEHRVGQLEGAVRREVATTQVRPP